MRYSHTQQAPLHLILHGLGFGLLWSAWMSRVEPVTILLVGVALLVILMALMFTTMTVQGEDEFLEVRYGPLPVFRFNIRYADIDLVERGRSSFIDGWGIHWIPGRGWTYNLWGFDCATLTVQGKTVRIGTDDVDNLVEFLSGKVG